MPTGVYKREEWHKQKISKTMKGKMPKFIPSRLGLQVSSETREKQRQAKLGRKLSLETKQKMSLIRKGRLTSEETKIKIGVAQKGKKISTETLEKLRVSHLGQKAWNKGVKSPFYGEKHWNWQGGKTEENKRIRQSLENKVWREAVFKRDDYTCIECNIRGGKLEADHIKPFSLYPELRFAIDNGRTLCKSCHKKIGYSLFKENNPKKIINNNKNIC